jgi:hypothetical protein
LVISASLRFGFGMIVPAFCAAGSFSQRARKAGSLARLSYGVLPMWVKSGPILPPVPLTMWHAVQLFVWKSWAPAVASPAGAAVVGAAVGAGVAVGAAVAAGAAVGAAVTAGAALAVGAGAGACAATDGACAATAGARAATAGALGVTWSDTALVLWVLPAISRHENVI